ncbi:MAG: repressor LexA [Bacteroidales bacterium]|jgi:phage repressor protein C with HTH and peptisase S24 domain|nr:repressor LexA [Bacteroidales bacterium]MDN5329356.1 repressor LexA [Bacteroidales bacterium]
MSKKRNIEMILNKIKEHYGFKTNTEFAAFLGIAPTTLSSWYARQSVDYDLLYSKCVEIDGNWLLTGEGPMLREKGEAPARAEPAPAGGPGALPLLPVRALAGLGSGELQVQISDIDTWYRLPDFPQADFIIPISGDSMLPTYKSGDLAICKRVTHYYNIVWGRLYVVYATEMGALFKRIYPADDDNFVILRSDNAAHYPDIRIKKTDLLNISLVLGIIRKD